MRPGCCLLPAACCPLPAACSGLRGGWADTPGACRRGRAAPREGAQDGPQWAVQLCLWSLNPAVVFEDVASQVLVQCRLCWCRPRPAGLQPGRALQQPARQAGRHFFHSAALTHRLPFRPPAFPQARSIVLTSGTLSPMDSFASELGVTFHQRLEAPHVVDMARQVGGAQGGGGAHGARARRAGAVPAVGRL